MGPEGWTKSTYGDTCEINRRSLSASAPEEAKITYLDIGSIVDLGCVSSSLETMTFGDAPSRARRIVVDDDVVVSTVRPHLRAFARIRNPPPNLVASTGFAVLTPTERVSSEFLFQTTCGDAFLRQLEARMVGSNYPAVNISDVAETHLLLPPLPEQEKIAEILSSVDEAIATTRKVIEQTERVKKGLLQTLMTRGIGHTRFKQTEIGEIPEAWEVETVGAQFHTQLGKMLSKAARTGPNQVPYLANAQVQWGRVVLKDLSTMHFSRDELEKFSLEPGDLLICEGGDAGRTAIWEGSDREVSFQKAIHRLRPKARTHPRFMLPYMRFAHDDGRLADFTSRTSIAHLTQTKLRQIPIPVPPVSEQHEIASQFNRLDEWIRLQERVLAALQHLKRGLLQDLLTGRVRVPVD